MKNLIICLLALMPISLLAGDYVDDINSSMLVRPSGQQVIYEMNVGTFTQAGTFEAAQQQLDELKTLGVDIVWLMPIYPRGTSGSPYAATNFQKTNPKYGSIDDLKAFVSRAHELSMEVWLDWVPNHTATNADWVTSHPEYYAKNGGQMIHPNNYGDVWQLDYNNAGLVNAMNECLKFWIDQCDIDGYRCDYISSSWIPVSYWQNTIPLIKQYKSGKTITFLGEADIVQDVARLKTAGFDYDYAWQFQGSLANYGSAGNASARLKAFANTLLDASKEVDFGRMLYLTNHDQNFNDGGRTLTKMYGDNRYPLTVFAYTLYGMPMIYNGQETGGNQILDYFADTKIDWNTKDAKMRNTIRTLTAIKHAVPALSDATQVEWVTVTNNSSVLAYTKKLGDSQVLVILNMAAATSNATLTGLDAGEWSLWLNSENIAQGTSRKQQTLGATQPFTIEAKGYRVYVKGNYSEEEPPAPEVYTPLLDSADEISIFFETPASSSYSAWVWGNLGGGDAYCTNTSWPGDAMSFMGQTSTGANIYKYTITKVSEAPQYLIISKDNGNTKIYDGVDFVNHGYYVEGKGIPTQVITTTNGIEDTLLAPRPSDGRIYTINGELMNSGQSLRPGIYISNGQKFIIK